MISGNLEAKLMAGAYFGGIMLFALAMFVLLPAGLIALINRSGRQAVERVRREGARCQVFVKSYRRVSMTQHRVLFELYLPESWTNDPKRRREAKIPEDVVFKTKLDLALGMIERAVRDEVPGDILLADSAYGDSHSFRETVRSDVR